MLRGNASLDSSIQRMTALCAFCECRDMADQPVFASATRMAAQARTADVEPHESAHFHFDPQAVDDVVPSVNNPTTSNQMVGALRFASQIAKAAVAWKKPLSPANPHECSRIASKFTVKPNFGATAKRRRRFGVKF